MRAREISVLAEKTSRSRSGPSRIDGFPKWMLHVAAGLSIAIALLGHSQTLAGADELRAGHQDALSHRVGAELRPGEREPVFLIAYRAGNPFDPQSARETYNEANAAYGAKEYDRALSLLNRVIQLEPEVSVSYSLRGAVWFEKKEFDKAIADLNKAIQLDPQNAHAYVMFGFVWYAKEEFDKAIADLNKAIQLDPKNRYAHKLLGSIWHRKEAYDKALAELDTVIRIDPRGPEAYAERGGVWYDKAEYDKAIADFTKAIRLNRQDATTYARRSDAYRINQEHAKALADLDQVVRLNPKLFVAHVRRGITLLYLKKHDKAIEAFDRAIMLDPNDPSFHLARGLASFLLRRAGAEDEMRKILKSSGAPQLLQATAALVGYFAARRTGRNDQAKAFLDEAARFSKPDGPYPVVAYLRGEIDERELLAAATDDEKMSVVRCYLALDLLQKGNQKAARAHFAWVVDHPGSAAEDCHLIAKLELDRMSAAKRSPRQSRRK